MRRESKRFVRKLTAALEEASTKAPPVATDESEAPPLAWGEIPAKWVSNGFVRLCVAKGTLVPDLEYALCKYASCLAFSGPALYDACQKI